MFDIGTQIAGWQIDELLHQGSMATTYRVHKPGDDKPHALKLLFVRDPSFQERLRRAASVLVTVRHPHLVSVVGLIEYDGMQGIVSTYIEGSDLATWASAEKRPLTELMPVFLQLTRGLKAAHSHGLVHRNLKPGKVLIDLTGRPHVHDFMLGKVMSTSTEAAVTQMGTTFGTPQYMPPEQFRGAALVDERADLFSLGCLLFELITGQRAFEGKGLMDIYQKVAASDRPSLASLRSDVPDALDQLVTDLTKPDPNDRIQTTADVIARIDGDPVLRQLINPLHSTATPVAALTSEHPSSVPTTDETLSDEVVAQSPPSAAPTPSSLGASRVPTANVDEERAEASIIEFDNVDDSEDATPAPAPAADREPAPAPAPEPQPQPQAAPVPAPAPPPAATQPLTVVEGVSTARVAMLLAVVFIVAIGLGMWLASYL